MNSPSCLVGFLLRRAFPYWPGLVAFATIPLGILFTASWHRGSGAMLGDSRGWWMFLLPYVLHAGVAGIGVAADRKGRVALAIASTFVLGLGGLEAQADFREMTGMGGIFVVVGVMYLQYCLSGSCLIAMLVFSVLADVRKEKLAQQFEGESRE